LYDLCNFLAICCAALKLLRVVESKISITRKMNDEAQMVKIVKANTARL